MNTVYMVDVYDERDKLQNELDELQENFENEEKGAQEELNDWMDENKLRLDGLNRLIDDVESCNGNGNSILVYEGDMSIYAREYAEEIDNVDFGRWPYNCIDWNDAADALMTDLSSVKYDGDTYYLII